MSAPNTLEVCRSELFTKETELRNRYPDITVDKVLRVREMYNWFISNPDATDREFIAEVCQRHDIHRTTAYSDLGIVKALLPMLAQTSQQFHRWRTGEMLMATYRMAERRKDARTMERAASSYGKFFGADKDEDEKLPLDLIVPQPFTATDDPRVLGIEPMPNLQKHIDDMIKKYRAETIDIEDVDFEDVDTEFDVLFPDKIEENHDADEKSLL